MPITTDDYAYPFDPTGTATTNKISNEVHVITQQNHKDYYFVIPKLAPFFGEGLTIYFTDATGTPVQLEEGADYYFGHHFLAASRAIGKQVYGSISFINKQFKGVMQLGYQTLGGKWTYDQAYLNQLMTNIVANPRISTWDSIVELPGLFPVIDHEWNLADMVGMSDVVSGLFGIETAIRDPEGTGTGGGSGSELMSHILNKTNPHAVTKLQIGLGNVDNYLTATQTEAEEGLINNKFVTPLLVKRAIDAQANVALNSHILNLANPHSTTKDQVGLGNVDNFATATQTEAEEGIVTNKFVTPALVKKAISVQISGIFNDHINDVANPHITTKAQVGLGNVSNYLTATKAEAEAGIANDRFVTPLLVSDEINALVKNAFIAHENNTNNPHQVTATQAGTYPKAELDLILLNKLGITEKAYDSNLFNGLTLEEVKTIILSGTAYDTNMFDGMDSVAFKAWVLQGTAINSEMLEGKTFSDILEAVRNDVGGSRTYAEQNSHNPVASIPDITHLWTNIAIFKLPGAGAPIEAKQDAQYLIAGCDSELGDTSTLYYLRIGVRKAIPEFQLFNFAGKDVGATFGYTVDTGANELYIWIRTLPQRNVISVTQLSKNNGIIPEITTPYVTEPTGITYVTETKRIADTDLFNGLTLAEVTTNILAGIAADASMLGGNLPTYYAKDSDLDTHTTNISNPHAVTKAQVGLGSVVDYAVSTKAEAEAGTISNKYMTPLRTAEAIEAKVGTRVSTLESDINNLELADGQLSTRISTNETNISTLMTDLTTLFNSLTV